MKRRLFTLLSALSLLLFLTSIGMWMRSYWWWETVQYRHGTRWYALGSGSGQLVAIQAVYSGDMENARGWHIESERAGYASEAPQPVLEHLFKLAVGSDKGSFFGVSYAFDQVSVPYLYLLAGMLLLPGVWYFRWLRRAQRRRAGLCRRCGYDLRATPGRCPECGMEAAVTVEERVT